MEMDINIDSYDWGNINSPWIGAEPHIWDSLTQGRPVLQYPAKSVIFSQGDAYKDAFIIMSGRVRHSVFSKVGLEKQVYIACPGAMIGEISCILSKPHSMTATAIVPTGLVKIPSKELQRLFHSSPMLADLMLQYEARKAQMMAVQQASLSFDTAETRIAKHLLCLCDTYGVVRRWHTHRYSLYMQRYCRHCRHQPRDREQYAVGFSKAGHFEKRGRQLLRHGYSKAY